MAQYKVIMCNHLGVPYGELANALVEQVTWELNGVGSAQFSINTRDPQVSLVVLKTREVQIWRNGTLIFWGIPIAGDADPERLQVRCAGLLWYLAKRFFGPLFSNLISEFILNGGFELATPLDNWTVTNPGGLTATVSTSTRLVSNKSAKLVQTNAGVDSHLSQGSLTVTTRSRPVTYTLSAWVFVESFTAGAFGDRGLYLAGTGSSTRAEGQPINANTPVGKWTRMETKLVVPGGSADDLEVRLYAPQGTVYWDQVRLYPERMTGADAGEDYNVLTERVFKYGAGIDTGGGPGTAVFGAILGKTSLNIGFTAGSAAGAMPTNRYYSHEDNGPILGAFLEVAARNVLDFEITWNSTGTTRTFRTYAPRKGSSKPALSLELGRNIESFRYTVDASRMADNVRVVGRNVGEIGQAQTGALRAVEAVTSPSDDIDPQGILDLATQELARLQVPVSVPQITVSESLLDAGLTVGDTVPVRMSYGWVQEVSTRRVVGMTLHPSSQTLDLVVNE